ncbi:MAG TPA: PIN domain-containing protein [Bryobacteraceae bacterium]|nr:PIN domain-containing protein [Bryobacteraceae bacterium]
MGLILDSSVVIAAERLGQTAYQMLEAISQQKQDPEIAISVVTIVELAHGIARADTPQRRAGRQQFLDDLLAGMPVQPVTIAIALRAGQADGLIQSAGKRMALADLLIGSTAFELGYSVATANVRHFAMLPGLLIEQL